MAIKLKPVPKLSFDLYHYTPTFWAYRCIEHSRIEIRVHKDQEGKWFRQIYIRGDEPSYITYENIKRAYRALMKKKRRVKRVKTKTR